MSHNRKPSPQTRLLSHVLVGLSAGALISQKTGANTFPIAAVLAAFAHEALDAPVAQALSDLGV
jgi:hypothetical protein